MDTGVSEEQAALQVLGISYRELGIGVARHWNFPDRLLDGMQRLSARDIAPPTTDLDRLKVATNLANDLYVTALRSSQADKTAALQAISQALQRRHQARRRRIACGDRSRAEGDRRARDDAQPAGGE